MPSFQPSRDEFLRLASEYTLVPVWREVLGDLETPVGVYRKLGAEPNSFLLESVEQGERWGRYSFIGLNPFTVMTARDGAVTFDGERLVDTIEARFELRAIHRYEFEHLLARAGLEVDALYGWFDERPLGGDAREQIWVARKP